MSSLTPACVPGSQRNEVHSVTIRNRRSRTDAMVLRSVIAGALAGRSLLQPLTNKQLAALLGGNASLTAVARARRWVEAEYARDELVSLRLWIARARRGEQPDAESSWQKKPFKRAGGRAITAANATRSADG